MEGLDGIGALTEAKRASSGVVVRRKAWGVATREDNKCWVTVYEGVDTTAKVLDDRGQFPGDTSKYFFASALYGGKTLGDDAEPSNKIAISFFVGCVAFYAARPKGVRAFAQHQPRMSGAF